MNETLRVIKSRRSIRSFKTEQVKHQDIELIVESGLYAPSASNPRSLRYTVIQKPELIDRLSKWIIDEIETLGNEYLKRAIERSGGTVFRHAPTVVVISSEGKDRFGAVNAAAATENMLIAAESLGIGSCWIGMIAVLSGSKNLHEYTTELMLPEGFTPQIGVTLGYKASPNPEAASRNQDIVSYIE